MNKHDKIHEGLILLDDRNNYVTPETPMVKDTFQRVPFPVYFIFNLSPFLRWGLLVNNGGTNNHTKRSTNSVQQTGRKSEKMCSKFPAHEYTKCFDVCP